MSIVLGQVPKETALGPYKISPNKQYREAMHRTVHERKGGKICLAHSQFIFLVVKMYPTDINSLTLLECIICPLGQTFGKPDTTL